jgi:2-polyprenyl-6-methoxyphenol hydroxylase-like FAD-dependent oxidoreductase
MTKVKTALVIGGGIAGPAVALALRKAGIEPTVYEAYKTTADGLGGTLTLAPNGLDALRIIGADEAVGSIGQPLARTVMADGRGATIGQFAGLADLPPSQGMWRPELYRAMYDCTVVQGIAMEYGRRLVDVEETPDAITAHFADGSTATGDVIIGADGIHSTVRTLIDADAPGPENVPLLNFGGVADVAPQARPDAMYFVFGKRAFFGYWVQPDGRTAWFGNLPRREPMTFAEALLVPAEEWLSRFREIYVEDEPGSTVLRHTTAGNLGVFGSMEIMPRLPHWHRGRMVLVGDSAHAPSSSSGQGASLAIESAIQLARCLRDLPELPAAFGAYERLRRGRVEKVAARARRTNSGKTLGPAAIAMMKVMMPIAIRTFLTPERTLGLEQRYRIDWDEVVRV